MIAVLVLIIVCLLLLSCDHCDLRVLSHSCPTRLSSDLAGDRCHPRGCRCNRHSGRADRPQLRAPGGGAALMLTDSVERRAAPGLGGTAAKAAVVSAARLKGLRSEEHTSELQSLMRHSYAVHCLYTKKHKKTHTTPKHQTLSH